MMRTVYLKSWKRAETARARASRRARRSNCRHGAASPLFAVEGKTCMKIHLMTMRNMTGYSLWFSASKTLKTKRVLQLKYGGQSIRVTLKPQLTSPVQQKGAVPVGRGTKHTSSVGMEDEDEKTVLPSLWISPRIRESLRLPEEGEFFLRQSADEWSLGPCVGFYSNLESTSERPFGEQTNMFIDLSRLGAQKGVDVVILTPGYLRTRRGWRFDYRTERFVQMAIPHPDIIIRRSGTFLPGLLAQVVEDLNSFKSEGKLHTLPRICGNKWALYQTLKTDPQLSGRFPETVLAKNAQEVYRLIQQKGDVYVKPVSGAQGIQVYHLFIEGGKVVAAWERRLQKLNTKTRLRDNFQTDVVSKSFASFAEFSRFWRQTRLHRCLVQDTVVLPRTLKNEPFDFRWLVQNCGEYTVLARVARIGQSGAVTTNIHTGARAMAAETALKAAVWLEPQNVIRQLDEVALRVAERLEAKYGPFAEVGVDMAVRPDGRVFVFEANPTPGRRMLRSLNGDVRKLSLVCLLEYAMRATGFELESR